MDILAGAQLSVAGVTLLAFVITEWRSAIKQGSSQQKVKDEIEALKKEAGNVATEISIVKDMINKDGVIGKMSELTANCHGKMAAVEQKLDAHIVLPSHADLPQKVAGLEARVINLEKKDGHNWG